ncbi:MAG: tetratricopeptide repeat protein [Bacteroidetes bacterium]|nr:tetratricopeptide repeat protein [Bacteroidota bacterium]
MNINYKFILVLVLSFVAVNQNTFSQSNEELVQNGINEYQDGNYENAIDLFNHALKNTESNEQDLPIVNVSEESNINVSTERDVQVSKEGYAGVSGEELVGVSKKEYTGVSTEKYISDPLQNEGSELGKIYLYRGRANMQLGNKEEALQDFDKSVQLNPSYSEAYFRRAIANHNLEKGDVCEDLKKAMEMGHSSAETLYKNLCN